MPDFISIIKKGNIEAFTSLLHNYLTLRKKTSPLVTHEMIYEESGPVLRGTHGNDQIHSESTTPSSSPLSLIDAVKTGNIDHVAQLAKQSALLEQTDRHGNTPLAYAAAANRKDMMELLLKAGADFKHTSKNANTALAVAHSHGTSHKESIDLLIRHWFNHVVSSKQGIDTKDAKGKTLLYWAAEYAHKDIVLWLLENGAHPLAKSTNEVSPLEIAHDRSSPGNAHEDIYLAMHKHSFPWIYNAAVPEHVRTLLLGATWKLPEDGSPLILTYSFDKASFNPSELIGIKLGLLTTDNELLKGEALNDLQRKALKEAFAHYESLLNIKFIEADSPDNAQLFIRQADLDHDYRQYTLAHTDRIEDEAGYIQQASITLDKTWLSDPYKTVTITPAKTAQETYYYHFIKTIKHELGHVLGLGHPNQKYPITETVMSYNRQGLVDGIYPETLMPNDLEALLMLYPANPTYRGKDDIYVIQGSEKRLQMITDKGGTDTIDASDHKGSATIHLTPRHISTVGHKRFVLAPGTEIENVKGAQSNNIIKDNDLDNVIDLTAATGVSHIHLKGGNDQVYLAQGQTTLIIDSNSSGIKRIVGFDPTRDRIDITGINLASLRYKTIGSSTALSTGNTTVFLQNVPMQALEETVFSTTDPTDVLGEDMLQVHDAINAFPAAHPGNDQLAFAPSTDQPSYNGTVITNTPEPPCFYPDGSTNIVAHQGTFAPSTTLRPCNFAEKIKEERAARAQPFDALQQGFTHGFLYNYLNELFVSQGMPKDLAAAASEGAVTAAIAAYSTEGAATYFLINRGTAFVAPYVKAYMEQHPEYKAYGTLAEKWGNVALQGISYGISVLFSSPQVVLEQATSKAASAIGYGGGGWAARICHQAMASEAKQPTAGPV